MPELPEVETVVRGLAYLAGRKLRSLEIFDSRVWFESPLKPKSLEGLQLLEVARRGKYILLRFQNNITLIQHLRMTGKMLDSKSKNIPDPVRNAIGKEGKGLQIRSRFSFTDCDLLFYDPRRFGTLTLVSDENRYFLEKKIAPDPFHRPEEAFLCFQDGVRKSKRPIKTALLDQSIIAGVGNIYADEALFLRKIHPQISASRIRELKKLWQAIIALLERSITSGGSSIRNYVNASGEAGTYAQKHLVYGKTGEPCSRCGALISRIVLGGRATHFCLSCQPDS